MENNKDDLNNNEDFDLSSQEKEKLLNKILRYVTMAECRQETRTQLDNILNQQKDIAKDIKNGKDINDLREEGSITFSPQKFYVYDSESVRNNEKEAIALGETSYNDIYIKNGLRLISEFRGKLFDSNSFNIYNPLMISILKHETEKHGIPVGISTSPKNPHIPSMPTW